MGQPIVKMLRVTPFVVGGAAAAGVAIGGVHLANLVKPHGVPMELNERQSTESYERFLQRNAAILRFMLEGNSAEEITSWEIRCRDLREAEFLACLREGRRGAWADYLLERLTNNRRIIHTSVWVKKGDTWIEIEFGPAGITMFLEGRDDLPQPTATEIKILHANPGEKRKRGDDVTPQTWLTLALELGDMSRKLSEDNYGLFGYNCNTFSGAADKFLGSGCLNNEGVNAQAEEMRGVVLGVVHAGARVGRAVANTGMAVANTGLAVAQAAIHNPVPALAAVAFARWRFGR